MKSNPYFVVDAFANKLFSGNQAGVCPLEKELPAELMQVIAAENQLSETAFFRRTAEGQYALQWFTPENEVDLCGHATLASAHVLFEHLEPSRTRIEFSTKSGILEATKQGDLIQLRFPLRAGEQLSCPPLLAEALGTNPLETRLARDYMVVLSSEAELREVRPNFELLKQIDGLGVIVTAPSSDYDFSCRTFFPKVGIPEDPVTGSAFCTLAPYWSERLGKSKLRAVQRSKREGEVFCEVTESELLLSGQAQLYLKGEIFLPQ